jgi:hypothetical protein
MMQQSHKSIPLFLLRQQSQWWRLYRYMKQQPKQCPILFHVHLLRWLVTLVVSSISLAATVALLLSLISSNGSLLPTNTKILVVNAYQSPLSQQQLLYPRVNIRIPTGAHNNHFISRHRSLSSSSTLLRMHMGHTHSHHEHLHSDHGAASLIPNQTPSSSQLFPFSIIIRTRRFIAMIIFCTVVAILGPSLFVSRTASSIHGIRHTTIASTKLSTRLLTFAMTSMVIMVAEPIRNSIQTTIQRIRSLGEGISKHTTPITASYLFQNTNDADRITLLGYVQHRRRP